MDGGRRDSKPRVGISACLLGERVRYDGGHRRADDLLAVLEEQVVFVSVCPEVEVGMGVPRPPIRIETRQGAERLILPATGEDWTERMDALARRRAEELDAAGLDGFILKERSPSCGLGSTPLVGEEGPVGVLTSGRFADVLRRMLPDLPMEEAEALRDEEVFDRFLGKVRERFRARRG